MLATSLQPLGAAGEQIQRVSPLPVPAAEIQATHELTANEAAARFSGDAGVTKKLAPMISVAVYWLNGVVKTIRFLKGIS